MIQVGFSMHPNWATGEALPAFLEPLRAAGLTALEFELDSNDARWAEFGPLMAACQRLGFRLCFHAPYRVPRTIAGFADTERRRITRALAPLYRIAAEHGPATVVVHGAKSADRGHELLVADTEAFLQWVLDRYSSLTLALENLNPDPTTHKVGTDRGEVTQIVARVAHPRLGLCWDIGHDLNAGRTEQPEAAWLRQVRHVHIHDLDPQGVDHVPLIYGQVDPHRWLQPLVGAGFAGIVTLELNGRHCASLWPDRIMPALTASVRAITRALQTAQHPLGEEGR
jgi:sugar phosphate isomerase/epimerase